MDFLVSQPCNYRELFGDHLGKTIIYLMDVRNVHSPNDFIANIVPRSIGELTST